MPAITINDLPKTIKSWLMLLEEPHQSRAINNSSPEMLDSPASGISEAIFWSFEWKNTPEGGKYWQNIFLLYNS